MIDFVRKPQYGYEDLLEIIRLLRSEDGCPWDKAQTHQSIRRGLLEEAYEAAEAIDNGDPAPKQGPQKQGLNSAPEASRDC